MSLKVKCVIFKTYFVTSYLLKLIVKNVSDLNTVVSITLISMQIISKLKPVNNVIIYAIINNSETKI